MKQIGWITLASWVATLILAYLGLGGYLYEALEGMDRAMIPLAAPAAFVVMAVVSIVLSILWARQIGSGDAAA
ncbi:MAG: hypothetical protein O3B72_03360, partial [Proteobacteria bacterium]|nr:hypothetical protein [Pseudomonadota bacterium]